MKKILIAVIFFIAADSALADESVNIPLNEFKKLYKENIKKEIKNDLLKEIRKKKKKDRFIYSLEKADYLMEINSKGAIGEVNLAGNVISGTPKKIKIFTKEIIIKSIKEYENGNLIFSSKGKNGVFFLPESSGNFGITLSFYIPSNQDNRSDFIAMHIPGVLQNSLKCKTSKDISLIDVPGVKNQNGYYNFPPSSNLLIRFTEKRLVAEKSANKKNLYKKFKTINTPEIVLDKISFTTIFEENGNSLSILKLNIPPSSGSHIKINSVPGSEIWSLKVNNEKMKVYSEKNGAKWIIPIKENKGSHIELAIIKQNKKLGLHGRLDIQIPAIEYPAKDLFFSINLPKRVDLVSFEGALSPNPNPETKYSNKNLNKSYHFKRSFYKGRGMKVAAAYKEPAK